MSALHAITTWLVDLIRALFGPAEQDITLRGQRMDFGRGGRPIVRDAATGRII